MRDSEAQLDSKSVKEDCHYDGSTESKEEEIRMAVACLQHLVLWRCYDICPLGPPHSPAKFLHLPTVRPVSKPPLFFLSSISSSHQLL